MKKVPLRIGRLPLPLWRHSQGAWWLRHINLCAVVFGGDGMVDGE